MRTLTSVLSLVILFSVAGELHAQQTSAQDVTSELRTMAAEAVPADQDRQVVEDFLNRADVGEAAATHGLDLERVRTVLSTLGSGAVADLARRVENMEDPDQVGGSTIVISTTAIIIGLLILILLLK